MVRPRRYSHPRLTHVLNGSYATLMLSFLGAEIIKVEPPGQGEKARSLLPVRDVEHESYPFIMLNSNKRGITLNLKTTRGKELLKDLVKEVDIIVENFALGVMDKLGLGYDVLKQIKSSAVYRRQHWLWPQRSYSAYRQP